MGIVVPETCWASNKICNKNHLLHLVGILFLHIYILLNINSCRLVNIYRRFGGICLRLQGNSLKKGVLLKRRHMPQDLNFQYRCENLKFSNVLVYLKRYWPHQRNLFCSGSMLWVTNFPCSSPKRSTTNNVTHFPNSAQLSAFLSEISAAKFHAVLQTTTGN